MFQVFPVIKAEQPDQVCSVRHSASELGTEEIPV